MFYLVEGQNVYFFTSLDTDTLSLDFSSSHTMCGGSIFGCATTPGGTPPLAYKWLWCGCCCVPGGAKPLAGCACCWLTFEALFPGQGLKALELLVRTPFPPPLPILAAGTPDDPCNARFAGNGCWLDCLYSIMSTLQNRQPISQGPLTLLPGIWAHMIDTFQPSNVICSLYWFISS